MHDQRAHPLLQQTPLSVNPFIDLPKPPTLPPHYATLPSTLPPSSIAAPPAPNDPDARPAYVTAPSGFAAHPRTIAAQNRAVLEQQERRAREAREKVEAWERGIADRELAERRRKAPGWLDSDARLLEPASAVAAAAAAAAAAKAPAPTDVIGAPVEEIAGAKKVAVGGDLGAAMDRAFGRSEMGS